MRQMYDDMLPTLRVKREIKRRMARIAKKHFHDNPSKMRRQWIEDGIAKHDGASDLNGRLKFKRNEQGE